MGIKSKEMARTKSYSCLCIGYVQKMGMVDLIEEGEEVCVEDVDGAIGVSFFDHAGYVYFAGSWFKEGNISCGFSKEGWIRVTNLVKSSRYSRYVPLR